MKKELLEIANAFSKKAINRDGTLLLIENKGVAIVISHDKYTGYQASMKIRPNLQTGSSVGLIFEREAYTPQEVIKAIKKHTGFIPLFYSYSDIQTINFLTMEQAINLHNNILGYKII